MMRNLTKPLRLGMRVLDPCCGSGVFLVLVFRRLIELHLQLTKRKPTAVELRKILVSSIFGIERNAAACYVAEFSLLLTLLSYLDPPELHARGPFHFPTLHGSNIRHADFFDEASAFDKEQPIDWIIGNPPWFSPGITQPEAHLRHWLSMDNRKARVAHSQVAEAFAWRVGDFLSKEGCAGLLMPAGTLTKDHSARFRRTFMAAYKVERVTNRGRRSTAVIRSTARRVNGTGNANLLRRRVPCGGTRFISVHHRTT